MSGLSSRSRERMENTHRHLVLGGSRGIGYAYAAHFAELGDALELVARDEVSLSSAVNTLKQTGNSHVSYICCDLTDEDSRAQLISRVKQRRYDRIFIGGPTPPSGILSELSDAEFTQAYQSCLAYPFAFLRWASSLPNAAQLQLVVVSSSAVSKPVQGNPFAASALFRSGLDEVVDVFRGYFSSLDVWYPDLVWTPLAEAYAARLFPEYSIEQRKARLAKHLDSESAKDIKEYVREVLK